MRTPILIFLQLTLNLLYGYSQNIEFDSQYIETYFDSLSEQDFQNINSPIEHNQVKSPMKNINDIYIAGKNLVWLGIDFQSAQFIGVGFNELTKIQETHFTNWHLSQMNESYKKSLFTLFDNEIIFDYQMISARNSKIEMNELTSNQSSRTLTNKDLDSIINSYDFDLLNNQDGIGMVYLVESLNKNTKEAHFQVLFIDLSQRKIISSQKIITNPSGFGFENYWGNTILECNKTLVKKHKLFKSYMLKDISIGKTLLFSLIPGGGHVYNRRWGFLPISVFTTLFYVAAIVNPIGPGLGLAVGLHVIDITIAFVNTKRVIKYKLRPFHLEE